MDASIVKMLLSTGQVNIDSRDNGGMTPLAWAARAGNDSAVKMLLDTGKVNIDSRDVAGSTPLAQAAGAGNDSVVKMLLETGKVDIDSRDIDGITPLSLASWVGRYLVVKILLTTGGKVNVNSKSIWRGRTPLSWAAAGGREAVVRILLNTATVDVNTRDNKARTPLMLAKQRHKRVAKILLDAGGVEIDLEPDFGLTAYDISVLKGAHW